MASTRSSKRTASEALVSEPAPSVLATDAVPMADTSVDTSSVVPASAASTTEMPAAADTTESFGHKAKRVATETTATVKEAVTQAGEAVAAAASSIKTKLEKKIENQSSTTTVTKEPYAMKAVEPTVASTEPSVLDKASAMAHKAGDSIAAAANSALASAEHVAHSLTEKAAEQGAVLKTKAQEAGHTIAASTSAMTAKVSSALSGKSGEAVSSDATLLPKEQISDASHSVEKSEGSLPGERNADEFPHARPRKFEADTQLKDEVAGKGASVDDSLKDVPLGSSKADGSFPTASTASTDKVDAAPDLLTGSSNPVATV